MYESPSIATEIVLYGTTTLPITVDTLVICVSLFPVFLQLLLVDKVSLKRKGMTEGAANKLLGKIEELK